MDQKQKEKLIQSKELKLRNTDNKLLTHYENGTKRGVIIMRITKP